MTLLKGEGLISCMSRLLEEHEHVAIMKAVRTSGSLRAAELAAALMAAWRLRICASSTALLGAVPPAVPASPPPKGAPLLLPPLLYTHQQGCDTVIQSPFEC